MRRLRPEKIMRSALLAGLVLAAIPAVAAAQTQPYFAVVSDSEVLLRAGPSDKYPETGMLKRGAQVVVDHEEAGWLAIQAPKGSISWVQYSYVDFDERRPGASVTSSCNVTFCRTGR